jgi:putative ABC transport system permease protein
MLGTGPRIGHVSETAAAIAALTAVDEAVPLRLAEAEVASQDSSEPLVVSFLGAGSSRRRPWTVVDGRDVAGGATPSAEVLLNRQLADLLRRRPGEAVKVRPSCGAAGASTLPPIVLTVVGIAEFPFDDPLQLTAATTLSHALRACGDDGGDDADLILVAGADGAAATSVRAAIQRLRPDLHAATNGEVVARLQAEFSYFRQISAVLVTVTLAFAFLLITVLLTVSVNQRLGEIAALRALGFSQRRVVADVLCESALIVGLGGALALPLGLALAQGLDRILKAMPGLPSDLHFFVFEPRAVAVHIALLAATAILAALYPMRMVARLPIAATLRREVVS